MGLRETLGDVALPSTARGTGTFTSGPVANAGTAADVLLMVHVTAASGTGPTLNASLEQSSDGTSWSGVTGSGITQMTAAGNAVAFASITASYVRVTVTIAGTTPSFTFRASVLVIPE